MFTMKISFSRSATIQVGELNFDKIFFSAEEEFSLEDYKENTQFIKDFVNLEFEKEYDKIKQQIIVKELKDKVRFYEKDGKKYPSVTSILSFAKGFENYFKKGYAQRGTVLHAYMERYIKEGMRCKFDFNILVQAMPQLAPELKIVSHEGIPLEDLRVEEVIDNIKKLPIEFHESEQKVFNDEHVYAGTLDARGTYFDIKTLFDFKSGSSFTDKKMLSDYWQQMAAYIKCLPDEGIKQMCIIPFDTKLKGIRDPIVSTDIDMYFSLFLAKRNKFRDIYKI